MANAEAAVFNHRVERWSNDQNLWMALGGVT